MNSTVIDDLNKFVENVNYANKILYCPEKKLKYSMSILSNDGIDHEKRMNYLKQYISAPEIKELIGGVEKRVNDLKAEINGPDL